MRPAKLEAAAAIEHRRQEPRKQGFGRKRFILVVGNNYKAPCQLLRAALLALFDIFPPLMLGTDGARSFCSTCSCPAVVRAAEPAVATPSEAPPITCLSERKASRAFALRDILLPLLPGTALTAAAPSIWRSLCTSLS